MKTTLFTVANPPVATGFTVTVPVGRKWRVKGMRLALATNATAGNRIPYLSYQLQPNDTPVWQGAVPAAIIASKTAILSFGLGLPNSVMTAGTPTEFYGIALPDIWLPGGAKISLGALGVQSGDQFSAIALALEKDM